MMKRSLILLALTASAVITQTIKADALKFYTSEMPELTEEEQKIPQYKPITHAYRYFKFSKDKWPRLVKKLGILLKIEISDENTARLTNDVQNCKEESNRGTSEPVDPNVMSEKEFKWGSVDWWVACPGGSKVELMFFANQISGEYSKIVKIVDKEICEINPKTGEEECHTEKVRVEVEREFTEELKSSVSKAITNFFYTSNIRDLPKSMLIE